MKKLLFLIIIGLAFSHVIIAKEKESSDDTILEQLGKLKNNNYMHLQFDTRFDYLSKWGKSGREESKFNAHTFKILLYGNITDRLSYRFRHRLNRTDAPDNSNFAKATDMAYLEYKLSESFSVRAGKMLTQYGTFEFDYNPADVFVSSMCNNDLPAYSAGLNLEYRVSKQSFNVQIISADYDQFAAPNYNNKAMAALALWNGNLFNGIIKTRYGFAMFQHDSKTSYNWLTLGTQLNIQKFTAEFDMFRGRRLVNFNNIFAENYNLGQRLSHDMSLISTFKYRFQKFEPQLKFIWDEREDKKNDASYHAKKAQLALLYYPCERGIMQNLSFHLVYAYSYTNYNGNFKGLKPTQQNNLVLLGVRWPINVF